VTKADAEACVDQVMDALDEGLAEALGDVTVYIVEGRTDPELRAAIQNAGMPRALVRQDFRGLYLGTCARTLDEDAGGELPDMPAGSIVLNSQALEDLADVRDTLAHEIGHALGMSEAEVENLGLG
jgi:predicted Zn-dependent protease with MMP-like domain